MAETNVGFPLIDTPFVDREGLHLTRPWYQFLRGLWMKTGQAGGGSVQGTILADGNLQVTTPVEGESAQVIGPTVSPYTFTATFQGSLLVNGAQIEFSRDSGATWYVASLTGGLFPLLTKDQIRLTWYGANAPTVVYFPGGA